MVEIYGDVGLYKAIDLSINNIDSIKCILTTSNKKYSFDLHYDNITTSLNDLSKDSTMNGYFAAGCNDGIISHKIEKLVISNFSIGKWIEIDCLNRDLKKIIYSYTKEYPILFYAYSILEKTLKDINK